MRCIMLLSHVYMHRLEHILYAESRDEIRNSYELKQRLCRSATGNKFLFEEKVYSL
jgi:hypothetical protein